MNRKLICSGVLACLLLLQNSWVFAEQQPGVACSGSSSTTTTLLVKLTNGTNRPLVLVFSNAAAPNHSQTNYGGYHTNVIYDSILPFSGTLTYITGSNGSQGAPYYNGGSGPYVGVLSLGAVASLSSGSASCAGTGEGNFAFNFTVDGVTGYFQTGGDSSGYPSSYFRPPYSPSGTQNFTELYAPIFTKASSVPDDGSNNMLNKTDGQMGIGPGPWLFTYNSPSNSMNGTHLDTYIKFAFSIPQRDDGVVYAACPSTHPYPMGPLCYNFISINDQTNFNYQSGGPYQETEIDILVNHPDSVNVYRTGLNPFKAGSYDP